ncbi:MAG: hypothetical protein MH252_12855 [Thermosynechococcaceae cyanobacterium MS004]|nr:hypothetical protein [Thermosynechococcaceae cyanobacterium MS004]
MLRRLKRLIRAVNEFTLDLLDSLEIFLYRYPIIRWVFGLAVFALFLFYAFWISPALQPQHSPALTQHTQHSSPIIPDQRLNQILGFFVCLVLLSLPTTPLLARAIAFVIAVRGVPAYQGGENYIFWGILAVVLFIRLWFASSEASKHG